VSTPAASTSQRDDRARQIADAIDLVLSARFKPGARPKGSPDENFDAVMAALALARSAWNSGERTLAMRAFQKAGISSRIVAKCLRDGVLVLAPEVA